MIPTTPTALGRPTVVRDAQLDGSGNFKKYFLEYYHDAQPRHEGQGKSQLAGTVPLAMRVIDNADQCGGGQLAVLHREPL